uniref:Uncharacterized protein n=1 Tax=Chromera velia CCMP2878 TaxID=1169474 RepID=A0A0G4F0Z3_9ALVE|eukprot:Cvel_2627.t1-p1 / transcript=Cvel_2627.t1 / gene=Cvel_2627 / organism=Chromera_velia_CCMP2878 / gene_product=hypothetical protein / transcript_product=hypothetical protein / location=Cvel_scaffold104:38084-40384(+) / protein_length=767 / sequence_SO=supercontig / SO=protein_coding / is_pseudo=false
MEEVSSDLVRRFVAWGSLGLTPEDLSEFACKEETFGAAWLLLRSIKRGAFPFCLSSLDLYRFVLSPSKFWLLLSFLPESTEALKLGPHICRQFSAPPNLPIPSLTSPPNETWTLCQHLSLTQLDLSLCDLGLREAQRIFPHLPPTLEGLHLQGNRIDAQAVEVLCGVGRAGGLRFLHSLNMSENPLCSEGMRILSKGLIEWRRQRGTVSTGSPQGQQNPRMSSASSSAAPTPLPPNSPAPPPPASAPAPAPSSPFPSPIRAFKALNLSQTFADATGIQAFADSLKSGRLSELLHLNLSSNRMMDGGFKAIVSALVSEQAPGSLQTLNLRSNEISTVCAGQGLTRLFGSGRLQSLETLDVDGNGRFASWPFQSLNPISNALRDGIMSDRLPNLRSLGFHLDPIGDEDPEDRETALALQKALWSGKTKIEQTTVGRACVHENPLGPCEALLPSFTEAVQNGALQNNLKTAALLPVFEENSQDPPNCTKTAFRALASSEWPVLESLSIEGMNILKREEEEWMREFFLGGRKAPALKYLSLCRIDGRALRSVLGVHTQIERSGPLAEGVGAFLSCLQHLELSWDIRRSEFAGGGGDCDFEFGGYGKLGEFFASGCFCSLVSVSLSPSFRFSGAFGEGEDGVPENMIAGAKSLGRGLASGPRALPCLTDVSLMVACSRGGAVAFMQDLAEGGGLGDRHRVHLNLWEFWGNEGSDSFQVSLSEIAAALRTGRILGLRRISIFGQLRTEGAVETARALGEGLQGQGAEPWRMCG